MKNVYLIIMLSIIFCQTVYATNGMNLIGYGQRSLGMGGVGEAIVNNNESMMINPAGLAAKSGSELSAALSFMDPDVSHTDNLGNNADESRDRSPMPFVAYSRSVGDYMVGVGVFVQGGMGAEYDSLVTPFAAREAASLLPDPADSIPSSDRLESEFSHLKLTPTLAYAVSDQLRLGATLNLSYARAALAMFPNTSVAFDADSSGTVGDNANDLRFSGMDMDGLRAYAAGVSLGVQYQLGDVMLGASYTSRTKLSFKDGTAKLNMTAMGAGVVNYDAELEGISWPQEVSAGVGYKVTPDVLVSTDVSWLNWSDVIEDVRIQLSNPDSAGAPAQTTVEMPMDWDDQIVWKIGLEFTPWEQWAFRFGYNHGKSPVNEDYLRPQFPVISETHYTVGVGYSVNDWQWGMNLEVMPKTEKTNNNSDATANLFGVGSTETLQQNILTIGVSRRF